MKNIKYTLILLLLVVSGNIFSQDFPKRPDPPRLVNDLANLFSPEQADALERKLVAYNDSTSTQIAVVTISDIKGYDITDFTDWLAMDWKVGQKGINNGLMILIVPKQANGERGHATTITSPIPGTKEKNPNQSPRFCIRFSNFSIFSFLILKNFSIHSILPIRPIQYDVIPPSVLPTVATATHVHTLHIVQNHPLFLCQFCCHSR